MKKIISIVVFLLIALIALMLLRNSDTEPQTGIEIVWKNEVTIIAYDTLANFAREEITAKDGKKLQLIPMKTILSEFKIPLTFEKMTVFAQDSGNISFRPNDIEQVFLLEMNPESYRLVLPDDEFRSSWLKYITKIVIQ
jgi:hypothetical protein